MGLPTLDPRVMYHLNLVLHTSASVHCILLIFTGILALKIYSFCGTKKKSIHVKHVNSKVKAMNPLIAIPVNSYSAKPSKNSIFLFNECS